MSTVVSVLQALNAITPLGLAALLALVIFFLLSKHSPLRQMKDNHLHHMQASLETLVSQNEHIIEQNSEHLDTLHEIKADIAFVKGRLSK